MIRISHPNSVLRGTVNLPQSKSISNRLLILKHLYFPNLNINKLSDANDTQLLRSILGDMTSEIEVEDAGTVMRFLTATCALSGEEYILKGSKRMHQRPIGQLVDALRLWGAEIEYLEKEGYAPIKVNGTSLKGTILDMRNVKSSQFISALLMIMPAVGEDAGIKVDPKMHSWSFVKLTIDLMENLGIDVHLDNNVLKCSGLRNKISSIDVESDWTSFYYFLSMAALSEESEMFFPALSLKSVQAEVTLLDALSIKGIELIEQDNGVLLSKKSSLTGMKLEYNLKDFPDLAPTFALMLAALKQKAQFIGLESLKFKESDRDMAIAHQLSLVNASWNLENKEWALDGTAFKLKQQTSFPSFDDHRMLMSVAPLALVDAILIEDEEEVNKSFPGFWKQMESLGFTIEELD